jgi:hypothetical protein
MDDVKRIDIKEFREFGFLQEVNRQYLHPLGLALEIVIEEDGTEHLGGVWDYRDDPEGMQFGGSLDADKAERVGELLLEKSKTRMALLGYVIQPVGEPE